MLFWREYTVSFWMNCAVWAPLLPNVSDFIECSYPDPQVCSKCRAQCQPTRCKRNDWAWRSAMSPMHRALTTSISSARKQKFCRRDLFLEILSDLRIGPWKFFLTGRRQEKLPLRQKSWIRFWKASQDFDSYLYLHAVVLGWLHFSTCDIIGDVYINFDLDDIVNITQVKGHINSSPGLLGYMRNIYQCGVAMAMGVKTAHVKIELISTVTT